MKAKILLVVSIIVVLGILTILPVWGWFFDFFKPNQGSVSQLLITSLKSPAKVFIDGEIKGTTEADKEFSIIGISKGIHKVEIQRVSSNDSFYQKFEKSIDFISGTAVQIIWSAGPTIESSSGIIKYFQKQIIESKPTVKLIVYPNDSDIFFDDLKSNANIVIEDNSVHKIKVSKQGYLNQDTTVQMTKSNGDPITGYDLVVEVYLYQMPVTNL